MIAITVEIEIIPFFFTFNRFDYLLNFFNFYSNNFISGCLFASIKIGPFAINPIAKPLPLPESSRSL